MSKKVVLDTNVFVAAGFNPDSSSARILDLIRSGDLQFVWDNDTKRETRRILEQIPPLQWWNFDEIFAPGAEFEGHIEPQNYPEIEDSTDRKFAALADAARAILISNDDDLLSVRRQMDVFIQTPSEFIHSWEKGSD